jgi:DNA-binding transcriptional ArsR family regulator
MRPLFHPSIEDVTVEGVLHALSDPVRAAIYADIVAQECPQSCSNFLRVSDKSIPKSTLSQHFRILREAGLIRSERHGVEMHNVSRGDLPRGLRKGHEPARRAESCGEQIAPVYL